MLAWDESVPRHLNLSYCNIWRVHSLAFQSIPKLLTLSLEGNHHILQNGLKLALDNLHFESLEDANFSHMNITDILDFVSHFKASALRYFRISHNRINKIPNRTFFFLLNLRYLDLSNNEIRTIANFAGLSKLEYLNLAYNNLDHLDELIFEGLHELKILDLSHNSLTRVNDEPFLNLFNLNELDISCNQIQRFDINTGLETLEVLRASFNHLSNVKFLQHLRQLHNLDISYNVLTRLSEEIFSRGQKISVANFSNNAIFDINPNAFINSLFEAIDLSNNRLTGLANHGWYKLKVLYLHDNIIYNVTAGAFFNLTELQELYFQRNSLFALPLRSFAHLHSLKVLDLTSNPLGTFIGTSDAHLFDEGLERLETLRLRDTGITTISTQLLHNMPALRHLDLSKNKLGLLTQPVFASIKKLQELNLARNKLREFDVSIIKNLIDLSSSDLSENPFDCTCGLVPLCDEIFSRRLLVKSLHNRTLYQCASPVKLRGLSLAEFYAGSAYCKNYQNIAILISAACGAFVILIAVAIAICRYKGRKSRNCMVVRKPSGPTIVNYRFIDDTTLTTSSNSSSNSAATQGLPHTGQFTKQLLGPHRWMKV